MNAGRVYHSSAVALPRMARARTQPEKWSWGTKLLIVALAVSAFAVVYLKDLNRRLFIEFQDMTRMNQQAQVEWGKLMLEQSTWTAQANIQQIASKQLQMSAPAAKDIILLTK